MVERKDNILEFDILFMIRALWHYAWAIVLAMAVFGGAGFFYVTKFIPPTYTASAMVYVNNTYSTYYNYNSDTTKGKKEGEVVTSRYLVDTYMTVLRTTETLNEIIEKAELDYTAGELAGMVSATSQENSEIFSTNVTCENPDDAVLIANTITEVLPGRIAEVFTGSSMKTVQPAVSAYQSGPNKRKYIMGGALFGLLLVCAFVVIKELLDDKIYGEDDISKICDGIPVLASIPDLRDTRAFAKNYYYGRGYGYGNDDSKKNKKKAKAKSKKSNSGLSELEKDRLILCENMDFTGSEAYKVLRTNLLYHLNKEGEGNKVIGVVSADRSEGKSTTSINISYVFAQMGLNVLTIEGDLRLPTVAKRLGVEEAEGLTDLVRGEFSGGIIKHSGKLDNWHIITSGSRTNNPSEILASDKIGTLMTVLKKRYDIIVIDLPPINEVTDAMAIGASINGFIFVVKQNATKKMPLSMALQQVKLAGAPLTGFVLVNANGNGGKYGKYGNYRKYYYDKGYKYGNGYGYGGYGYGYGYGYRQPYGYGYGEQHYGYEEQSYATPQSQVVPSHVSSQSVQQMPMQGQPVAPQQTIQPQVQQVPPQNGQQ